MKKGLIILVCFTVGMCLFAGASHSITNEAVHKQKIKRTIKKKKTAAIKAVSTRTTTTEQNQMINTKDLQMVKERTTIIDSPTCECAPKPIPADTLTPNPTVVQ